MSLTAKSAKIASASEEDSGSVGTPFEVGGAIREVKGSLDFVLAGALLRSG
jgi:hypothetical protein